MLNKWLERGLRVDIFDVMSWFHVNLLSSEVVKDLIE